MKCNVIHYVKCFNCDNINSIYDDQIFELSKELPFLFLENQWRLLEKAFPSYIKGYRNVFKFLNEKDLQVNERHKQEFLIRLENSGKEFFKMLPAYISSEDFFVAFNMHFTDENHYVFYKCSECDAFSNFVVYTKN